VIASHYVEPLQCHVKGPATLRATPSDTGEQLCDLDAGTAIRILDRRSGWVWGYAGGLVGYLPAASVGA
jgi:hypothetical protein